MTCLDGLLRLLLDVLGLLDGKGLELGAGDDGIEEIADGLLVVVRELRNALEL